MNHISGNNIPGSRGNEYGREFSQVQVKAPFDLSPSIAKDKNDSFSNFFEKGTHLIRLVPTAVGCELFLNDIKRRYAHDCQSGFKALQWEPYRPESILSTQMVNQPTLLLGIQLESTLLKTAWVQA